jgi:ferredoxin
MSRLCVGCGICLGLCPLRAISITNARGILTVTFDYSKCSGCGICVRACPALYSYVKSDALAGKIGAVNAYLATVQTIKSGLVALRWCRNNPCPAHVADEKS